MDVERLRYADSIWDYGRYTRLRLVAEDPNGRVVAWGQIAHWPWRFHPRRFGLRLEVEPAHHGKGIGSAFFDRLIAELRDRDAQLTRTDAAESLVPGIHFLTRRGFREVDRSWDSRLDVTRFDVGRFAGAEERVARQGIAITTLATQWASDPDALPKLHALFTRTEQDEPSLDPATPLPVPEFVAREIEDPVVIPEAFFLARDGERLVGSSALQHLPPLTDVIDTGYTCVHADYRGQGIALALKLRAIRYAREHGYREIRTSNNARNEPMLRINLALGFVRQPAVITFERELAND